jgi:hypothetical protein
MSSSAMLRHVALVGTDILEECIASVIRKRRFLHERHGITSQKTVFSIPKMSLAWS